MSNEDSEEIIRLLKEMKDMLRDQLESMNTSLEEIKAALLSPPDEEDEEGSEDNGVYFEVEEDEEDEDEEE